MLLRDGVIMEVLTTGLHLFKRDHPDCGSKCQITSGSKIRSVKPSCLTFWLHESVPESGFEWFGASIQNCDPEPAP